jgi:hypothetical protein
MKKYTTFMISILLFGTIQAQYTNISINRSDNRVVFKSDTYTKEDKDYKSKLHSAYAIEVYETIMGIRKPELEDNIMAKTVNSAWSNVLLVSDWTGSMRSFMPKVLHWQHVQGKTIVRHLVMFNDGDDTPDGPAGKSGGIYFVDNPANTIEVSNMANQVKEAGDGGDGPENDIEALIAAIDKYGTSSMHASFGGKIVGAPFEKIILVADGNSAVRDMELLKNVKFPVHTVFCKQDGRYASDYLEIAYQTGGSVSSETSKVDFSAHKPTKINFNGHAFERLSCGTWKDL